MYDNRFFNGIGLRSAVYLSVVVVGLAISGSVKADNVPLPPPTTTQTNIIQQSHGFPSTTALINRGYDFETGTLKVPPKTTYGNATATTATKTNPIRITDPYGNVTKGSVTTQTQLPSRTTMSKAGAGLMGVAVVGGALNSEGATIGSMIAQGDYTGAGQAAVRGVLNALKGMGNFVTGGAISGVESAVGGYNAEKQRQSMAGAVQAAAEAKAAEAAAQAQAAQEQWQRETAGQYLPNPQTGVPQKYPKILKWWGFANGAMILPDDFGSTSGVSITGGKDFSSLGLNLVIGSPDACQFDCLIHWDTIIVTPKNYNQYKDLINQALAQSNPNQPNPADFMLTADELAQILQSMINQMLNNANANHTELINALAQLGALPANTPENTSVVGTAAENTFVSAPYTPAGTNQAQQTQHVVNRNGSITTSFIPRPDLGAHSSVAPTRTKVGTGTSGKTKLDIDIDGGDGSGEQQKLEICTDKTDETVMCLPAGSDDYEDLQVPQETEKLEFDKKNYFSRDAACPAPLNINAFGMSMEMSYEPWCEMARGIRPIIEFLGVLTAMGIAYGAVREL